MKISGKDFKKYYWIVNGIVITVIPFLISLVDNASEWKDDKGNINLSMSKIFVIFFSIVYLIYVIYVANKERLDKDLNIQIDKLNQNINVLESQISAYNEVISSINTITDVSQKDIYNFYNFISNNKHGSLLQWNFETVSTYICNDIVKVLSKLSYNGTDISANVYIRSTIKNKKRNKDSICMITHAGGVNSSPKILGKVITINSKKEWQNVKLFSLNNPKIIVHESPEEIKKHLVLKNGDTNGFNQYIGIPISCSEGHILSALEIIAHNETQFANTKKEILHMVNKYIIIYRNYALLSIKIEKFLKLHSDK